MIRKLSIKYEILSYDVTSVFGEPILHNVSSQLFELLLEPH